MKKIYKKYSLLVLVFLFSATQAIAAFLPGKIENPIDRNSIPDVLDELFVAISEIGAILLAVMIVYSGFAFVTAAGNDEKLRKAKASLTYVVIGGAIVLGAAGISELIKQTLTGTP